MAVGVEERGADGRVADAVASHDVVERCFGDGPKIAVVRRVRQCRDPGVFELFGAPLRADPLPIRRQRVGVTLHGGVDVQQRAVCVENDRLECHQVSCR